MSRFPQGLNCPARLWRSRWSPEYAVSNRRHSDGQRPMGTQGVRSVVTEGTADLVLMHPGKHLSTTRSPNLSTLTVPDIREQGHPCRILRLFFIAGEVRLHDPIPGASQRSPNNSPNASIDANHAK
jgi:hypothetical protein